MARASGSPLILVILVITSFRLQVQVLGKLEYTSDHARGHSGNLAWHLLELISHYVLGKTRRRLIKEKLRERKKLVLFWES